MINEAEKNFEVENEGEPVEIGEVSDDKIPAQNDKPKMGGMPTVRFGSQAQEDEIRRKHGEYHFVPKNGMPTTAAAASKGDELSQAIGRLSFDQNSMNLYSTLPISTLTEVYAAGDDWKTFYDMSGLQEKTGRSFEDIKASTDAIVLRVDSHYHDKKAQIFVIITDPTGEKLSEFSLITPSWEDQQKLNSRTKALYNIYYDHDYYRKHDPKDGMFINPQKVSDIVPDPQNGSLTAKLHLSYPTICEAMGRSDATPLLRAKGLEKIACDSIYAEATITKDSVTLKLTDTDLGETVSVPLTKRDEDIIRSKLPVSFDEIMKNAGKADKNFGNTKHNKKDNGLKLT